jgi:cytochrome c biogenesis protein CcdA
LLALTFVALALSPAAGADTEPTEPLQVLFFYEEDCGDCAAFKPILDEIEQEYGSRIEVTRYDVFTSEGWDVYTSYGFTKVPALVIGTTALEYESDKFTKDYVSTVIDSKLDATVRVEYFYEEGCDACDAFKPSLAALKDKYGDQITIVEYDVFTSEGWDRFTSYGFTVTPAVSVNGKMNVEYPETTYDKIDTFIQNALEGEDDEYSNVTQWSIPVAFTLGFFSSFSPCLMAVLSFILAYTAGTSKKRSEAMGKSVFFGIGLVIMYTLIAISMALLGQRLTNFKFYMSLVGAMITFVLGLNLINYVIEAVEIPLSTKGFSQKLVHQFVGRKGYLGAIVLGVIFSAVKLPCAAPALVVILTQIADKGNLIFGMTLIASFSLGVILPFIFIGILSGGTTDVARKMRWSSVVRTLVWGGSGIVVIVVSGWILYTAFDMLPRVTDTHFFMTLLAMTVTAMAIIYAIIRWRKKNGGHIRPMEEY